NTATPNTLGAGFGTDAKLSVQITTPNIRATPTGLDVAASGTIIKGLSLFGFRDAAIAIGLGVTGTQVLGNFIGLTALGSLPASQNNYGVLIGSTGNLIGSRANADRNLISGNDGSGVLLLGDRNAVVNNLIGLNKLGNGAVPPPVEGFASGTGVDI